MKKIFENIFKVFLFIVTVTLGIFLIIVMSTFIYVVVTGVYNELIK
jgi:hypothetical protein